MEGMDGMDERDIDDILPAGTPMLIDKIKYHTDGSQPINNNVDMDMLRRSRYPNPYTPFLGEHELEWASRLLKHGISNMPIHDFITVHTVKSNLPKGHFKSAHTLGKKIGDIVPDGIGQHWVLSTINYYAENSETPYYWRVPMRVVQDLLQNPSCRNDLVYAPCELTGKFGERIYSELHTRDWWWKLQVRLTG